MNRLALIGLLAIFAEHLPAQTPRLDQLDLFTSGWPRVFFFRASESFAVRPALSFDEWDRTFSRLQGIEGKVFDEEVRGRSKRNIERFSQFKAAHPQQMVMLHYNGLARDPQDAGTRFFAGHWLYFGGQTLTADVPAANGETEIPVNDTSLFKMEGGRLGKGADDIGICELDPNNKPDWSRCEQVHLLEIKPTKGRQGILRVQRAQYGTQPRAFARGRAHIAPHMTNGPWGKDGALLWFYNFATTCPRDANGRTATDVLVQEFGEWFGKGGPLESFDGVEFDVMRHSLGGRRGLPRTGDVDADGKSDAGIVNGHDAYAEGTLVFCQRLREKLGPDRLIMADGWNWDHVRAFSAMNGMESEGWPKLGDKEFNDWSGGLNRAQFWSAHYAKPGFNYINNKGLLARGEREATMPYHRLVFAGAMMTDSVLCTTFVPPAENDELFGTWDEWRQGTKHKLGWLGQPKSPPKHLAFDSADVLGGISNDLLEHITTDSASVALDGKGLRISGKDSTQELTSFKLRVPVHANGELLLRFRVSCEPSKQIPQQAPRTLRVGLVENRYDLSASWLDRQEMNYTFYATGLPANQEAAVTFDIEGSETMLIADLAAFAEPDAMAREYDHGVVLANPSAHPFEFNLASLFPGQKFRRLQATANQDTQTNNGQLVDGKVGLGARDGLFLAKEP